MPFVNSTSLLMRVHMRGVTENVYVGLSEFSDMAFLLHFLRQGDTFVDVGANVGAYTILAAGGVGSRVIALEPIASTFGDLLRNIALNGLNERVVARMIAAGDRLGSVSFTNGPESTKNHVSVPGDNEPVVVVQIETLNAILEREDPSLIKVDVEGFEMQVMRGADEVLKRENLLAIIIEDNGSALRYSFEDAALATVIESFGFVRYTYEPFSRVLTEKRGTQAWRSRNSLYVREPALVLDRLRAAPPFTVNGYVI